MTTPQDTSPEDGNVYVPSFQRTISRKQITAIYPLKKGAEIYERLRELTAQHREALKSTTERYIANARMLLPELKA